MNTDLSDELKDLLRDAGWNDHRRVDVTPYAKALEEEGYPVHQSVIDFLRSFGGIGLSIPAEAAPHGAVDFLLDPREAIAILYRERVSEEYDLRVGAPLCAVGVCFDATIVLLMDADGGTYGGTDEFLVRFGSSGEEALEILYRNETATTIPLLEEDP